jgi:large subunit ribosomal protein L31
VGLKKSSKGGIVLAMKSELHPTYHAKAQATCSCGETFVTGSTAPEVAVEVCWKCHPFYTGTQKLVDAVGRVDKFKKRLGRTQKSKKAGTSKKKKSTEDKEVISLNKAR